MADEKLADGKDSDNSDSLMKTDLHSFQLCAQDGTVFQVNPYFLAEFSPVFEKLFFGGFEEARQKKAVLQDETPQSIKTLLGVLGAKIEDADQEVTKNNLKVTVQNIHDLLRLASKFDIGRVYTACRDFIRLTMYAGAIKLDELVQLLVAVIDHPIPECDFMWDIADYIAKKIKLGDLLKSKLWERIPDGRLMAAIFHTCTENADEDEDDYMSRRMLRGYRRGKVGILKGIDRAVFM